MKVADLAGLHAARAEHLGGTRVRLTWQSCGHTQTLDLMKKFKLGKPDPRMVARLARYWADPQSNVYGRCPKCWRRERRGPMAGQWVKRERKG